MKGCVRDLARSLAFYGKAGFREVGQVAPGDGSTLVMLNLPGDGDVVTLERARGMPVEEFLRRLSRVVRRAVPAAEEARALLRQL